MADSPNDTKADLKSRLGLKSRSAAPPAAPIVPGAPPPEPDKPKKPTQATIDEAKRRAAEAEKEAGPAVEAFQFGAPERTPLPSTLPSGPRVEYIEVKGSEELPEAAKKRRLTLIMAVVAAALAAFVIGRMLGGQSARSAFNESIRLEAQSKAEFLDSKKATYEAISALRAQLEKVDGAVRQLDPEKGDVTTLEKDFADLLGAMAKFANNKQSAIDPGEAIGTSMLNGELVKDLAAFAYQTQDFQRAVNAAVEEAQTLLQANPVRTPDEQKLYAIVEPDTMDVEDVGKVPYSKGSIVVRAGKAEPVQGRDAAGNPTTDYYQKVMVEGRTEPVQIKTTQFVQLDMKPFWDKAGNQTKRMVLGRLAELASRLYEQSKKIDVKPLRATVQGILDHGGEAPPAEAPKAE